MLGIRADSAVTVVVVVVVFGDIGMRRVHVRRTPCRRRKEMRLLYASRLRNVVFGTHSDGEQGVESET